jgi:branched-subunit amino acid ABC-type transport system permease component
MADLLQTLMTAVVLGSLYALIALGYTMVFGVLKLINFAHSDVVALGAWSSVTLGAIALPFLGVNISDSPWYAPVLILLVAMAFCGLIGFAVERLAYKPIRKAPRLNALITAIGVSLLLQNVGQLQFTVLNNEKSIATGEATPRVPGSPSNTVRLPTAITIEPGYAYQVKVRPKAAAASTGGGGTPSILDTPAAATSPVAAPVATAGRPAAVEDRSTVRKIIAEPGTIAAGTDVKLEGPIGNAQLRNATIEVLRVSDKPAVRLPFGAKPASMPPGIVPRDSGETVADEHRREVEASGKFVEWRPSRAVLLQLNFFDKFTTASGAAAVIYKPVKVTTIDLTIVITALVLMTALQFLVFRTRVGTAMRAVSYNIDTAALMGIPVDRIVSITFVSGTMLAAAAGFLYALRTNPILQTADNAWVLLGLKAFVAAVVGGIGNIRGAALGGFLIAFVETFMAYGSQQIAWDRGSALTDVFVFLLLIIVLLVKPTGMLGTAVREKV